MPELIWTGKDKVIAHHLDVPLRLLEKQYAHGDSTSADHNRIIHGDNLEALKALLPEFRGRIKCIYIDPPYNTGNEGWVYNDNVNDPKIKRWLNAVVGKEGEDLSRHDKWLCMMYPRLKLLHELLADDGAIFISIDDNEQANLKLICDEIFGGNNFVAPLIWRSRQSVDARNKTGISNDHEYILIYQKKDFTPFKGVEKDLTKFSNPDNDLRGPWRSADLTGIATKQQRPNLHYDLLDIQTGIVYQCPEKGWRYDTNTMQKKIQEKRIIFPKNSQGRPRNKIFMNEMESDNKAFSTVILEMNTGQGTKMLKDIFKQDSFTFPKPVSLLEFLFSQIVTNPNDLILDSFAGSGTTAHAVLNLNKSDGGNRRFILVEMENYAENITAERVRRVIAGYGTTEGTGGGFSYYTLGEKLWDTEGGGYLNEQIPIEALRRYIAYTEGLKTVTDDADDSYFIGKNNGAAYYFCHDPMDGIRLTYNLLATLKQRQPTMVIYADSCQLTAAECQALGLIFKQIPRHIAKY